MDRRNTTTAEEIKRQVQELKQSQKVLWKRQNVIHETRKDQAVLNQRVNELDTRQRRIQFKLETGFEKVETGVEKILEEIRKVKTQ